MCFYSNLAHPSTRTYCTGKLKTIYLQQKSEKKAKLDFKNLGAYLVHIIGHKLT